MQKALCFIFLLLLPSAFITLPAAGNQRKDIPLLLMWWNVENLFDPIDDPSTADEDFTPDGRRQWTRKKLLLKQMRIRHVISAVKSHPEYMKYPDLLAFAEVENSRTFSETLSPLNGIHYKTVYFESSDPRGIDIGIAFNPETLSSGTVKTYKGHAAREIIAARFSSAGRPFHVILNHWPSRSFDEQWSEPKRIAAAKVCRHIIDSLLLRSPKADIIVMGDFNDEPGNRSIHEVLRSSFDIRQVKNGGTSWLFNCWSGSGKTGSYRYGRRWEQLDQILLSPGMFDTAGLSFPHGGFRCFSFFRMLEPSDGKPWPTYEKGRYRGGYSDHLPLILKAVTGKR
ncbi:MAG: endonuclease/exonuclease/phosphatase family protein [Chlorobiaceae bacterium]|nr:endonuclease/exonuclease/phosphatase family protein [Chlorobiaceae bacterium]